MKRTLALFILIILSMLLSGCGASHKQIISQESKNAKASDKVTVEAYLFDAKLKQKGKPTSVRLFFFQTDSVIAIGGKGYLGKGALKGWMNNDSILVTFPTLQEYLYESIDDLFASFSCTGEIPKLHLMSLFSSLPDEILTLDDAIITKLSDNTKRPEYQIRFPNCPWQIDITYHLKKKGYRIRNFVFDDGEGTTLQGKLREYKDNSTVPKSRFLSEINPDMTRIIP